MNQDTLAVAGAGGSRGLPGEPVIDARGAETGFVGEELQADVLHVVPAERPPAAVDVKADAGGPAVGPDDGHLSRPNDARHPHVPPPPPANPSPHHPLPL